MAAVLRGERIVRDAEEHARAGDVDADGLEAAAVALDLDLQELLRTNAVPLTGKVAAQDILDDPRPHSASGVPADLFLDLRGNSHRPI